MKGLLIDRPGHFEIVDVPRPEPFPDEVVVQVEAINSCTHWDLTVWDGVDIFGRPGHPEYPLQVGAPGHELSGVVVETGDQVTAVRAGDRVALWGSPAGRPPAAHRRTHLRGLRAPLRDPRALRAALSADDRLSWPEMAMLEMLSCVCPGRGQGRRPHRAAGGRVRHGPRRADDAPGAAHPGPGLADRHRRPAGPLRAGRDPGRRPRRRPRGRRSGPTCARTSSPHAWTAPASRRPSRATWSTPPAG